MFDVSRRLDAGRGPTISAGDGIFAVPGSPRPSWRNIRRHRRPRPSDGTVENTELGSYITLNNRSGQVLLQILNLKVSEVSA